MTDRDKKYLDQYLRDNRSAINKYEVNSILVVSVDSNILKPHKEIYKLLYEDGVRFVFEMNEILWYYPQTPLDNDILFRCYVLNKNAIFIDITTDVKNIDDLKIYIRKQKIKKLLDE
jgi:hypothetical protein